MKVNLNNCMACFDTTVFEGSIPPIYSEDEDDQQAESAVLHDVVGRLRAGGGGGRGSGVQGQSGDSD